MTQADSSPLAGTPPPSNADVAAALDEVAHLIESQGANPFRVAAYRNGARTVRELPERVDRLIQVGGVDALLELPGIGRSLAHSIEHLVRSGRLPLLERLRGEHAAERTFATITGLGPKLAGLIHDTLGIETLTELEAAAHDGRLAQVPGMGEKRLRAVREALASRFHRQVSHGQPPRPPEPPAHHESPVAELLEVDAQYRDLAKRGRLPRIAPRQFNPTGEAWLPVLHTQRGERHYTALFSNTAHAHELGTTHDWVILYRDDEQHGARWTVITGQYGPLRGRRFVRGREDECAAHYAAHPELAQPPPASPPPAPPAAERQQLRLFSE